MATYFEGIGRRKSSHARVRIVNGSGKIMVNEKGLQEYFPRTGDAEAIVAPLRVAGLEGKLDITVKVEGGGVTGQTGAVRHGLARAWRSSTSATGTPSCAPRCVTVGT